MIVGTKAPLRLGLAGGGTDVSPYAELYGGAVLNACINLFAHASIEVTNNNKITLTALDLDTTLSYDSQVTLPYDGQLDLLKGVYNHIVRHYTRSPLSFRLTTYSDVPKGSGLGGSSTIVVAVLGAFAEWLGISLEKSELARLAFEIERKEIGIAGGRQDQYAAAFGGFNFMEFDEKNNRVNSLNIDSKVLRGLEENLVLYYTGTSRLSSKIIQNQSQQFAFKNNPSIESAHLIKAQAFEMKTALLAGKLDQVGKILHAGWEAKKKLAKGITNPVIDEIYRTALQKGAMGGKISGAGGGGFMIFYCPKASKNQVMKALSNFGGQVYPFSFYSSGVSAWIKGG